MAKPRIAVYKHTRKIHQTTVYWCNLRVAPRKGLQFYQTRSNAFFLDNLEWNKEFCARYDAIAAEDHSFFATSAERNRRENAWVLVLNSSGPNGPMNQREDYHEAIKSKSDCTKSLVKVTQDSIPVNKFDNDQVNHSLGKEKELNESTPRLDGNGILLQPQQARLRRGGNHQTSGGMHGVGMNSDFSFNPSVKVFRLQAMAIPLQATGVVNTTPIPGTRPTSAHVIFLVWLKT